MGRSLSPSIGDGHDQLGEHVAPVMAALALFEGRQGDRQPRRPAGPVGPIPQQSGTHMGHNAVVAGADLKAGECCGTIPRRSALLGGSKWSLDNPIFPHPEGLYVVLRPAFAGALLKEAG